MIECTDSQVVGWPPLVAYRMNSFNSHAKSPATEVFNTVPEKSKSNNIVVRKSAADGYDNNNINIKEKRQLRTSLFVKVNMDGIPIGRKVDLSAHSSYQSLAQTLEDMFNESITAITCKGEFFLAFILIIKRMQMQLLHWIMSCFQHLLRFYVHGENFVDFVPFLLCVCFKYGIIITCFLSSY